MLGVHHYILLLILPTWVKLLQVHHHAALCVSALEHTASSTSSHSTLNSTPWSHFYKYITMLHSVSPLWGTLLAVHHLILLLIQPQLVTLLQVHHHAALCVSSIGHTASSTSYSTVNSAPVCHTSSTSKTPHCTSPLWDTLLAVHHYSLLFIQPRGSHFFYKNITILHSTSRLWDTMLGIHHHILLLV